MRLAPISVDEAIAFFGRMNAKPETSNFDWAIVVVDDENMIKGCIAMKADGEHCALGHLFTDGTALVGSILYGAAWRAAKALGYRQITL